MQDMQSRILAILRPFSKKGLSARDLQKRAGLGKNKNKQFRDALQSLESDKQISERGGRYYPASAPATVAEMVKVTATFGFARPQDAERDAFVPGRFLRGALPGDIVSLRLRRGSGELPEGEVLEILEPNNKPFAGVLRRDGNHWTVEPDRPLGAAVRVPKSNLGGAGAGDKVLAELTQRGENRQDHIARILESYGSAERAAGCCRAVLAEYEIPLEFPDEVIREAEELSAAGIHPKEIEARRDLRDMLIFTIDGADSKDLDDAVSVERLPGGGYRLGVHIADVSHYVRHGTALDEEALNRGTSVYYANSVIPMLPEALSNGICSLNPGEDRLAFTAWVDLDEAAAMTGYKFEKTLIRSRVKGVYAELNALSAGEADGAVKDKYREVEDALPLMLELYKKLELRKAARGSLDLESVESKVIVGPDGEAADIQARTQGLYEKLIEEFMLTANEAAASLAIERELPFVFRVHEAPDPDRITQLQEYLDLLDVRYQREEGKMSVQALGGVLRAVRGRPVAPVVNMLVLRSMAKARYDVNCTGHYGLALERYTHFTSPIRRYPDLTIHRILSAQVTGMRPDNIHKRYDRFVVDSAARSTAREIAAMGAERDCEDCYKAEYMRRFVGEEFDALVASCTPYGAYVQLPNTVEGLVHISNFPAGDWEYDGKLGFDNRFGGQRIRLGDSVRVRLDGVDVSAGQIDFSMNLTAGAGE